jgi:integrase
MASIHKDPRGKSRFWYCAFTLPDGRRAFKSTKLTDRNAALDFCLKLGGASKKSVQRNLPEEQARKILDEIRVLSGEAALRFRSLKAYTAEWLDSKKTTTSEGTLTRYKGIVDEFVAHVGQKRAEAGIETVTAGEVKLFRDQQVRDGKSRTTANLAIKTLRALFNDARREGLISVNPAEAVKTFNFEKESRDVFTHEQLRAIIGVAHGEWKTVILLAYYGGLRLSDAASLSWQNVSFERHEIRFFPRKTARVAKRQPDWKKHVMGQLEIPLMPEVEKHLLSLPSSDDVNAKLSPTLAIKSTGGNHGLSREFQRLMEKAEVVSDLGAEKEGKGRQFRTLGFHSLRHTFVSELANADVPADVRRQISGHSDEKIHERYTHLELESKQRALAKLRPLTGRQSRH